MISAKQSSQAHALIEMLDFSSNGMAADPTRSVSKPVAADGRTNRNTSRSKAGAVAALAARGGLFRKYVVMFVVIVILALTINGVSDIWFSSHEQQNLLFRIQREQAKSAADKIEQFLNEITAGLAWETQLSLSDSTLDEWQFDAARLLRQVPALTEIVQLDATGQEQFRKSREASDVIEVMSIIRKRLHSFRR